MTEIYVPEKLKLWTRPDCYAGESWPDYYVFLGRHRDSGVLTQSNFEFALAAIGGEQSCEDPANESAQEYGLVYVVRESHWAVGWVEWIAIHETAYDALRKADEIMERLEDYPVLDEDDFSRREQDEAERVWRECYSAQERIDYIRKFRSQFEFHDMKDLWGCVRGEYFAGYASELLY